MKKADGNKDTLAGMFVGLLYLFDVPTFLSSLTNFIQTYASLYPKQVGRISRYRGGGLAHPSVSVTSCSRWKDHWGYATSGLDVPDILGWPPWVGNMAPLSPDTDRTGSRDFAR